MIARQTATVTAQVLAEIAGLADSQLVLDQITLMPKRVGATTTIGKQLILQSTPDIEALVQQDIFQTIAVKHDAMYLNGTGANDEPLGILNTPGVNALSFGGVATFAKIVSFETALGKMNADRGMMAYATTPVVRGSLKTTAAALSGAATVAARSLWENGDFRDGSNDGIVNAYRAASSNQIPYDHLIFGNWNDLICAQWGGFDLVVDYWTKAKNAEIVLTANTWIDSAVRHAQSFTVSSDSAAQ